MTNKLALLGLLILWSNASLSTQADVNTNACKPIGNMYRCISNNTEEKINHKETLDFLLKEGHRIVGGGNQLIYLQNETSAYSCTVNPEYILGSKCEKLIDY